MKKHAGFTLIELMITVVIIGILGAIAYPTYQTHLLKGRRSAAQTHLMDISQKQQQYLLDARAYAPDLATLSISTPSTVTPYYTITVAAVAGTPPTFTVTATPIGTQVSDGVLTIDNAGAKTPSDKW